MENDEVVLRVVLPLAVVIVVEQTAVEAVQLRIACVEHCLRQLRVIQEESAAEVVHGFLCLGQELVGEEGHMVACLAEQLREEWIVTPLSLLACHMKGKDIFENETGQIPW